MSNPNLKKLFVSSAIAVFAGVGMLGVNAAFGVDGPLQEPENSKLVSPTFDNINVRTTIYNSSAGGVRINDGLEVTGVISNPNSNFVTIQDSLSVSGNFTAQEVMLGLNGGSTEIKGSINMQDASSSISNLPLIQSTTRDLWINIGQSLMKIKTNGEIEVQGTLRGANSGPLATKGVTMTGLLHVISDNSSNSLNGTTANAGAVKIGSEGGQQLLLSRYGIDSFKGDLLLNSFGTKNVKVGNALSKSNLDVSGNLNVSGKVTNNLNVESKVTAGGGFGTYTRQTSAFAAIDPNSIYETSVACPAATQLISCGAQGSDSTNYTPTKSVTFSNIDPYITTNTCYARGINTSAVKKYVRAIAVCLNPAI